MKRRHDDDEGIRVLLPPKPSKDFVAHVCNKEIYILINQRDDEEDWEDRDNDDEDNNNDGENVYYSNSKKRRVDGENRTSNNHHFVIHKNKPSVPHIADFENEQNENDSDYVYDEIDLNIRNRKNYDGKLIHEIYEKEYQNPKESSIWREKILEIVARHKSKVWKFAVALANNIKKPLSYVINEFPRDFLIPGSDTMNIKSLLQNLLADLAKSESQKEWYTKQVIIHSILASIREYQNEIDKNKHIRPAKTVPPQNKTKQETNFKTGSKIRNDSPREHAILNYGSDDEIFERTKAGSDFLIGMNIKTLNNYAKNLNELNGDEKEDANDIPEWVKLFEKYLSDFKDYLSEISKDEKLEIKIQDYKSLTSGFLDFVKGLNDKIEKKTGDPVFGEISDLLENYIYISEAYEFEETMPISFLVKMHEFGGRLNNKMYELAIKYETDVLNVDKIKKEFGRELEYLKKRFGAPSLDTLKQEYDFKTANKNFRLRGDGPRGGGGGGDGEDGSHLNDISELLQWLNQLDYGGKLDDKFIKPWKSDDNDAIAVIFFSDNIYGTMLSALNDVNVFANKTFKMMELITSEKIFTMFAKYVTHLYNENDMNLRVKGTSSSSYTLAYRDTRYQLVSNNMTSKGLAQFFQNVSRINIVDEKTKKVIGTTLVHKPRRQRFY